MGQDLSHLTNDTPCSRATMLEASLFIAESSYGCKEIFVIKPNQELSN